MNTGKKEKRIDHSKLNIGTELECFVVHADSLENISRKESQRIMEALATKLQWDSVRKPHNNEIQELSKNVEGLKFSIGYEPTYALLELISPPVSDLDVLEKMHKSVLAELRATLNKMGFMIWPFGVAPASMGLLKLPFTTSEELVDDNFYNVMARLEYMPRFAHMASEQVSIDVAQNRMMATVNAMYKNLGTYIHNFANAPVLANGRLYKAGRYYFWNDCNPVLDSPRYNYGAKPVFPPREFKKLGDFYNWIWQGNFVFVMRDGAPYIFPDEKMTIHKLFQERGGVAVDPQDNPVRVELTPEDIELVFNINWLDFKPHFDFLNFSIEDFMKHYNSNDLDGFFEKYCSHSWLEIRPCDVHFENNAMDIPKYFYEIFRDIDKYIKNAEKISWQEARQSRDKAIGYI